MARWSARRRNVDHDAAFQAALAGDPDPTNVYIYLTYVWGGWTTLFGNFALISVGLAFAGHFLDRTAGGLRGFAVGSLVSVACLVGMVDNGWRRILAERACRPQTAANDAARLIRTARSANNIGIMLQAVGGLLAAVYIWTIA